jgi:alpha-beta hydrolase superfamily lysophospholipase
VSSITVGELRWTGVGGFQLKGRRHMPGASPKAVVVLAHGINDHSGRYDHVVAALVGQDIAVYTIDHRGHGRSEGPRAQVRRFDDLVDDFELVTEQAASELPGIPLYVLGHSMGGLIATRYALRHQASMAGLILSAPAIVIDENTSPILRRLLFALSKVGPNLSLLPERHGLLSRDPEVERKKRLDPLNTNRKTTIGSARALLIAAEETQRDVSQLTLPLLVMHGGDDTLTFPSGSRLVVERATSVDKTLKIWPGLRHEIFNEPEGPEVITYVIDWLDKRIGP